MADMEDEYYELVEAIDEQFNDDKFYELYDELKVDNYDLVFDLERIVLALVSAKYRNIFYSLQYKLIKTKLTPEQQTRLDDIFKIMVLGREQKLKESIKE